MWHRVVTPRPCSHPRGMGVAPSPLGAQEDSVSREAMAGWLWVAPLPGRGWLVQGKSSQRVLCCVGNLGWPAYTPQLPKLPRC